MLILFEFAKNLLLFEVKNLFNSLKGAEINAIGSLKIIEGKYFRLVVKDLVVHNIIPKFIIEFVFEIKFYLKLWVSSLCFRIV